MGLEMVSWVRRYQGQCRALRPLGHQGYRLRSYKKDPPLHSGYKMQSGVGWTEKGRTQPLADGPDGAPMGAVGAAGSGSGTAGGANGAGGTTVSGSAGVEYQWSQASILDATAA